MLTTVKGTYQNGVVQLAEPIPPAGFDQPVQEVLVVFLEKAARPAEGLPTPPALNKDMAALLASWEQSRGILTGMTGPSLSDEVLAERREEEQ